MTAYKGLAKEHDLKCMYGLYSNYSSTLKQNFLKAYRYTLINKSQNIHNLKTYKLFVNENGTRRDIDTKQIDTEMVKELYGSGNEYEIIIKSSILYEDLPYNDYWADSVIKNTSFLRWKPMARFSQRYVEKTTRKYTSYYGSDYYTLDIPGWVYKNCSSCFYFDQSAKLGNTWIDICE